MDRPDLFARAQAYANQKGLALGDQLGFGVHGIVFKAKNNLDQGRSAVKVHEHEADYCRERDVYLRLQEHEISSIRGCNVPELIALDDGLRIIEMTVVARPFVLDFGGAFLDRAPDFSEEVLAEWRAEKMEQFGNRWPEVQAILQELERFGIYVVDVNPNNMSWPD
jgi:hypothetical protein